MKNLKFIFSILTILVLVQNFIKSQMISPCVYDSQSRGLRFDLTSINQIFQVTKKNEPNYRFSVGICKGVNIDCKGVSNYKAIQEWIGSNNVASTCDNLASNGISDVQMEQPALGGLTLWYLQGAFNPTYPQIRKTTKINVICDKTLQNPVFEYINQYFTSDRDITEFNLKSVQGCGTALNETNSTTISLSVSQQSIHCFGITPDSPNVCTAHGVCISENKCNCNSGYTGPQCQWPICYEIASVMSNVCNGNGKCIAPDNCYCNANFDGLQCQSLRGVRSCFGIPANNPSVCSGKGACVEQEKCNCFSGYTGKNCNSTVIPNQFTCFGLAANAPNVCNGNGACISQDTCQCKSNFSGNQCQISASIRTCFGIPANDPTVCSGNGNCLLQDFCSCKLPFFGKFCNQTLTPPPQLFICFGLSSANPGVCSGNGNCTANNVCSCKSGFSGPICNDTSIPPEPVTNITTTCFGVNSDSPLVCSSHGSCNSTDVCVCFEGWTGALCEFPIIAPPPPPITQFCSGIPADDPSVCSGNGNCTAADVCICKTGWTYYDCSVPVCFGTPANDLTACNGNGNCTAPDVCECNQAFEGIQCQTPRTNPLPGSTPICFGIIASDATVCNGHGNCTDFDVCQCFEGFQGVNCNETALSPTAPLPEFNCFGLLANDPTVCSGHGICGGNNSCVCAQGWTGENCETINQTVFCFGINANETGKVCSGHGTCTAIDICSCNANFTGPDCNATTTVIPVPIPPTPQVPNCFGFASTDYPNVCSGNGECVSKDSCSCFEGFTGTKCETSNVVKTCFGVNANDQSVCSGHGKCTDFDVCVCSTGFTGTDCSTASKAAVKSFFKWLQI